MIQEDSKGSKKRCRRLTQNERRSGATFDEKGKDPPLIDIVMGFPKL
jgi:hypothetical protein